MTTPTEPSYGSYDVEIRDPGGNVVHASSEFAKSAAECAQRVLRHVWPVNIYDKPLPPRRPALVGLAQHRVTVAPKRYGGNTDSGEWSVGEVLVAAVAAKVHDRIEAQERLREAKAALDKARTDYRGAQAMYRCTGYDIETYAGEAITAGVEPVEVEKAKKKRAAPRARRTLSKENQKS